MKLYKLVMVAFAKYFDAYGYFYSRNRIKTSILSSGFFGLTEAIFGEESESWEMRDDLLRMMICLTGLYEDYGYDILCYLDYFLYFFR